ncbi:MAG: zonular occludens toxin domain-containing protein [Pseudomonadota bacterium]
MSIVLVTGTPGAGKTLWSVQQLVEKYVATGRRIYHNIDQLQVEAAPDQIQWITDEGIRKWRELPDHSVFFLDECQRNFPRRNPMSAVPPWIEGFETHRHHGLDFYLITQGPMLIDTHIHPLVERHVHLYRPFGLKRSTVSEWYSVNPQPNPRQSRLTAKRRNFRFPKKLFKHYKSASQHTVEQRIPWPLLLALPAAAGLFILCMWGLRSTFAAMAGGELPSDGVLEVEGPPPPCLTVLALLGRSYAVSDGVRRLTLPAAMVETLRSGGSVVDGAGKPWALCVAGRGNG